MAKPPLSIFASNGEATILLKDAVEHHKANRLVFAEEAYKKALIHDPGNFHGLRLLGALYLQEGRYEEAKRSLSQALLKAPENAEILNNLAVSLQNNNQTDLAASTFLKLHKVQPLSFERLIMYGGILYNSGRWQEAIFAFEAALTLQPEHVESLVNLAMTYHLSHQPTKAIALYQKALGIQPDFVEAHAGLGAAYWVINKLTDAIACYQKALALRPEYVHALVELGCALAAQDKFSEAEQKYKEALRLEPNNSAALSNLGALWHGRGERRRALSFFDKALEVNPEHAHAKFEKSMALLALGNYIDGWKLYETGLGHLRWRGPTAQKSSMWDGRNSPQKRLLIWSEQGHGDSIQFIRYASLCKRYFAQVYVQCPQSLMRLFNNCPDIDAVFDLTQPLRGDQFDEHVAMMSLPFVFKTTLETIPAHVPYLFVSQDFARRWAMKFENAGNLKVGLVWSGSSENGKINNNFIDMRRSIKLSQLAPLLNTRNVHFYSLQKGKASAQLKELDTGTPLTNYMNDVDDFLDTAALIENLDLIISVDTSVAHLAGALGKPVWILSRYDSDWRWLENKAQNPWYPTARIFGQPSYGDWSSVIENLKTALSEFAQNHKS